MGQISRRRTRTTLIDESVPTLKPAAWLLAWSVAYVSGSPGPRLRPSRAPQPLDWAAALELARWHRLLPLVHYATQADQGSSVPVPPSTAELELENAYRGNIGRGLVVRWDLKRLLSGFETDGIPVILLKGVAVDDALYPQVGIRPHGDIDLLVSPSDLSQGESVLESLGFRPAADAATREAFRTHHHHLAPYWHPRSHNVVELHGRLGSPNGSRGVSVDGLWERAQPANLQTGESYLALCSEDLLAYLCLHFLSDRQVSRSGALFQLCDIALLLSRPDLLDWRAFADRVEEQGLGPAVYAALHAASIVGGVSPPDSVTDQLRPADFDEVKASHFVLSRVIEPGREVSVGLVEALAARGLSAKVRGLTRALRPAARWTPGTVSRQSFMSLRDRTLLTRPVEITVGLGRLLLHLPELSRQVIVARWLDEQSAQGDPSKNGLAVEELQGTSARAPRTRYEELGVGN